MSDDEFSPSDERSAVEPGEAERAILGDPNNPKRPPRENKKQRLEREQTESSGFWRGCLATEIGRRELWRLIADEGGAHFLATKFPKSGVGFPDANEAWYSRGEQDFGLRLYHQWIKIDFLAVAKMHQENDPRFAKGE